MYNQIMSSFLAIPYYDIINFLKSHNNPIPILIDDAYREAWNVLINNPNIDRCTFINDYLIAHKLVVEIPIYRSSYILSSNDEELSSLSNLLLLTEINRERIIRILSYLNKLDADVSVFTKVPDDILGLIFSFVNHHTIKSVRYISKQFNSYYESENYDNMLRLSPIKMELNYKKYAKFQLMNIFLMKDQRHIYVEEVYILILTYNDNLYLLERSISKFNRKILMIMNNVAEIICIKGSDVKLINDKKENNYLFHGSLDHASGECISKVELINESERESMQEMYIKVFRLQNQCCINSKGFLCNLKGDPFQQFSNKCYIEKSGDLFLDDAGRIYALDYYFDHFAGFVLKNVRAISSLRNIISITGECKHHLTLDNKGNIYYFWYQRGIFRELKMISGIRKFIEISVNEDHGVAIDDFGRLYLFELEYIFEKNGIIEDEHMIENFNVFVF